MTLRWEHLSDDEIVFVVTEGKCGRAVGHLPSAVTTAPLVVLQAAAVLKGEDAGGVISLVMPPQLAAELGAQMQKSAAGADEVEFLFHKERPSC